MSIIDVVWKGHHASGGIPLGINFFLISFWHFNYMNKLNITF